jgi:uncharacterized protein YjbI with pentapeptide repeats
MSSLSKGEILERLSSGATMRGSNLVRTDLSSMQLAQIDLAEANLRMADLSSADLREARLNSSSLSGATLIDANLTGASLVESSLIGAILNGADLSRADLSGADLTGANLRGCDLQGAFLVGTFLNETDLTGADLSNAFVRMAQMTGADLSGARLEMVDLSNTDLSGARLDSCCLAGANLSGANLTAVTLSCSDLRGANLSGADLSGCNLTGARLRDVKFDGIKLDDAWADWVNLARDEIHEDRASLEEVFVGIIGKPLVQLLVQGRVGDDVCALILAHLCRFQVTHPNHSDVRLRGIHQGIGASAIYLEAEHELSLAAYLFEFADIIGTGSVELFERLATVVAENEDPGLVPGHLPPANRSSLSGFVSQSSVAVPGGIAHVGGEVVSSLEALQRTPFWTSEKALVVLTANRRLWLESCSQPDLTLRPPHGATIGIDLVRGQFVTDELRRGDSSS